jgi:hypothetical protein
MEIGEDIKKDKIEVNNKSIVLLKNRSFSADVSDLEEKYSKKFGCQVIILDSNIDYIDKING